MSRVQFDREQVLERATKLFWQYGFYACSMQQVFKATGLKPGSLYLAFGNKVDLFQQTLVRYTEQSLLRINDALISAPSPEQGICQLLEKMVNDSANNDYCSCFLIKSQLELTANDDELGDFISRQLGKIENLYTEFLSQTMPVEQARQRATSLMVHIFGIRVYGYHQGRQLNMLSALKQGLNWLPWSE